jgi:hypothetical protein
MEPGLSSAENELAPDAIIRSVCTWRRKYSGWDAGEDYRCATSLDVFGRSQGNLGDVLGNDLTPSARDG